MFGGTGEAAEQAAAKTFEPGEGLPEAEGATAQGQASECLPLLIPLHCNQLTAHSSRFQVNLSFGSIDFLLRGTAGGEGGKGGRQGLKGNLKTLSSK